jgi:predicted enzyme related to lactoylglutathione lyase
MQDRLIYTHVYVSDQDRALDFYTNVLGFERRTDFPYPDGPRFLTVALNGQDFELVLWPGTPGQAQPLQTHTPATHTIETEDCRKAYEELSSRGVKFETGVLEFPWGDIAVFRDPDGNRLQVVELKMGR